MEVESPLVQPGLATDDGKIAEAIRHATGLRPSSHQYTGWLGIECPDVRAAIWIMRALVVSNVLSRREGTVVFVPVNPESDPNGETVIRSVSQIHGFAKARKIL
jgi:hypothetical protein